MVDVVFFSLVSRLISRKPLVMSLILLIGLVDTDVDTTDWVGRIGDNIVDGAADDVTRTVDDDGDDNDGAGDMRLVNNDWDDDDVFNPTPIISYHYIDRCHGNEEKARKHGTYMIE